MRFSIAGIFVIYVLSVCGFLAPHLAYADAACGVGAFSADGYFFTGSAEHAYSADGLLEYHFHNDPRYAGRPFTLSWEFADDECNRALPSPFSEAVSLPDSASDWSVRFASSTHFDVWDDKSGSIVKGIDVPFLPSYAKVTFRGLIDGSASTFITETLPVLENGLPPVFSGSLETPPSCSPIAAAGYYFDLSEHAEYVDGLLRVHVRLKTPYNDGRPFHAVAVAADESCTADPPLLSSLPEVSLPPYLRYYSFRMVSPTRWQLWDDERDEAASCASCGGDIPAGTSYVSFYAAVDGAESTMLTTPFPPEEPRARIPVVVIPGILGSQKIGGRWAIDPILHTYDNLIATLVANGYEEGKTLFTFPYQWRNSNTESAYNLKERLETIKKACNCDKVDIVAHSMGGLVARSYIEGDHYQGDVRKVVFLGTPHSGAPKAYLAWEGGEIGDDLMSRIMKILFTGEALEHGYPSLLDYLQKEPVYSVKQLLPVYDYLQNADGAPRPDYPDSYPRNAYLEKLDDPENVAKIADAGVSVTNVAGVLGGSTTVSAIRTTASPEEGKWIDGYPEGYADQGSDRGLIYGEGDGTVPLYSAVGAFASSTQTVAFDHVSLPTDAASTTYAALTGESPQTVVNHGLLQRILFVRDFSPVDIVVTAPDGRRVGKDFSSGGEVNEIPGAFYSGADAEDEFVTIPDPLDGIYTIATWGTGSGPYALEAAYADDATSTAQFFSGETEIGSTADQELSLTAAGDVPVEFVVPDAEADTTEPDGGVASTTPGSEQSSEDAVPDEKPEDDAATSTPKSGSVTDTAGATDDPAGKEEPETAAISAQPAPDFHRGGGGPIFQPPQAAAVPASPSVFDATSSQNRLPDGVEETLPPSAPPAGAHAPAGGAEPERIDAASASWSVPSPPEAASSESMLSQIAAIGAALPAGWYDALVGFALQALRSAAFLSRVIF